MLLSCATSVAQHTWSFGIEGGAQKNIQSGKFEKPCPCGSLEDGVGYSPNASAFVSVELNKYFHIALSIGVDTKSISASKTVTEEVSLLEHNPDGDTVVFSTEKISMNSTATASYIFIRPQVSFFPFEQGLFLQVAPMFESLTSSHFTSDLVLLNPPSGAHFTNNSVNSIQIALYCTLGYSYSMSEHIAIEPKISYNAALSNISNSANASNWKISSLSAQIALVYTL
jgi:hypothetical protein